MIDAPAGFTRRKGSRLVRAHIDLPPGLAAVIAEMAARGSVETGERVTVQAVLRRLVRKGLGRKGSAS